MRYDVSIDGLNVSYDVVGDGNDIILLHGWGCDLSIFKFVQEHLSSNFKVWSLDFPGFGASSAPENVWGVEEYTSLLEKFVNNNNIVNPILLGHSFGGRVSIVYASRNNVKKLILVDSAGVPPLRSMRYYFKVYKFKLAKHLVPYILGEKRADKWIQNYRNKAGSSDYNSAKGVMKDILVKVVNEDLRALMPKISVSTLLVWGENDTATPMRDAKIMNKLIPDSGIVSFRNAGHFSFVERKADFLSLLDYFLECK